MAEPDEPVVVTMQDGMHFVARGEDGHLVPLDSSSEHGGMGAGFRPMELLLVGLAGCTAMDVVSILRKKRQDVTAYRVEISGTQASDYPKVFTDIAIRHIVEGNGVSEDAVRRAIELSETKYCPAFAMLKETANIASSFQVVPAAPKD